MTYEEEYERDQIHRRINYELCTAIDLIKLGIVLERMVSEGGMHEVVARTCEIQASALLTSIRNANNLAFGKGPQLPIR